MNRPLIEFHVEGLGDGVVRLRLIADAAKLREAGVAAVFTPKDFDVNRIMGEIVDLVGARAGSPAPA